MNFLSHFFIDGTKDDHYLNTGLVIPDLLGFHKGKVRLTELRIEKINFSLMVNTELSMVNTESSMVNTELSMVNTESSMVNTESLMINAETSMINAELLEKILNQKNLVNGNKKEINTIKKINPISNLSVKEVKLDYDKLHNNKINNILSLSKGMIKHLKLDRLFHNLKLFKDNVEYLQKFLKTECKEEISNFQSHIIIEMLIDKWILDRYSEIDQLFYSSIRSINLDFVLEYLSNFEGFNKVDFEKLFTRFSLSTYIGEYTNIETIIDITNRVSNNFGINQIIDKKVASLILKFYNIFEKTISDILDILCSEKKF